MLPVPRILLQGAPILPGRRQTQLRLPPGPAHPPGRDGPDKRPAPAPAGQNPSGRTRKGAPGAVQREPIHGASPRKRRQGAAPTSDQGTRAAGRAVVRLVPLAIRAARVRE